MTSPLAQVYKERVLDVTVNCATEALAHGVKRFIQMSCARVYDCDKVSNTAGRNWMVATGDLVVGMQEESKENSPLNPWTQVDKFRLKSEEALAQTEGLSVSTSKPAKMCHSLACIEHI